MTPVPDTKSEFVSRLTRLVANAIREVERAHPGEFLPSSVAKRVATQLWAETAARDGEAEADWIRRVRGLTGMTRDQLAAQLEVDPEILASWEEGRARPPLRDQVAIELLARGAARVAQLGARKGWFHRLDDWGAVFFADATGEDVVGAWLEAFPGEDLPPVTVAQKWLEMRR